MIWPQTCCSYNDISTNATVRDYVGWAWYDREFYVPNSWVNTDTQEVFVRFGSVHYHAKVWLNGHYLGEHAGGHLPFQFGGIENLLVNTVGQPRANWITVAVNNTLSDSTVPQGKVKLYYIHHSKKTVNRKNL